MNKSRIDFIDIAKGIGIILVVIGHTQSPINNFIYLFHMPLFFFISGYLYKDEYTYNIKALIKSRIKSLYFPFCSYGIIFILLHNTFISMGFYNRNVINYYSIFDIFINIFKTATLIFGNNEIFLNTFWFLTSLFFLEIIFSYISRIKLNLKSRSYDFLRLIIIITITIFANTILFNLNHYSIYRYNIGIPLLVVIFYYLGYIIRKISFSFIKYKYVIFLLFFILIALSFRYIPKIDLHLAKLNNPIYFYFSATVGIFATILFATILAQNQYIKIILQYIGKFTIAIMAFHTLSFKLLSIIINNYFHNTNNDDNYLMTELWLLYCIFGIIIPLFINYIINRCKLKFNYDIHKTLIVDKLFNYLKF
jgi:fucose 4-O-acetylase-like acetyltransferase